MVVEPPPVDLSISIVHPDWSKQTLPVCITREQVRYSPGFGNDQAVSRLDEERYLRHYGYARYWTGAGIWGEGLYPCAMAPGFAGDGTDGLARAQALEAYRHDERAHQRNDHPQLRSCNSISGYRIHGTDGHVGYVTGFLVDDETWAIRYLVVDTSRWWVGHKVLIAPSWIKGVHRSDQEISLDLSRKSIKHSPAYDEAVEFGEDQELDLSRHYGRSGYWTGDTVLETAFGCAEVSDAQRRPATSVEMLKNSPLG